MANSPIHFLKGLTLYFLKKYGGHVKEVAKCQKFWTYCSYHPHHKKALNLCAVIHAFSFCTFLDILIMVLTSNLVEILISGVLRPHELLVTLQWISVISWPMITHVLSVRFRTNLTEIFIRGSTDLINSWSYLIEFPSYSGLWLAIHFPCILDKLVEIMIRGSSDLIKIWSYVVEFPSSSEGLSTCCTFQDKLLMGLASSFVKIFIRVVHIFD